MKWLGRIVHFFLKIHLRICLPLYFGKFGIYGLEHVPRKGPVIFAANHQNTLLDALIVGSVTSRNPYFITRGDVFRRKAVANFFRGLKMIPVFRFRDGLINVKKNADTFQESCSLLKKKKSLLIFPEGDHRSAYYLRPLQKGIARLGLDTEAKADYNLGILIVPVGIYYESYSQRGYPAMIQFGKPISLARYFDDHRNHPQRAYNNVLKELDNAMQSLIVHIDPPERYEQILGIWRTIRIRKNVPLHQLENDQALVRYIGQSLENGRQLPANNPDQIFGDHSRLYAVLKPIHFLPEVLTDLLAEHTIKDPDFKGSVRFVASIVLYPLFYLVYIFLAVAILTFLL